MKTWLVFVAIAVAAGQTPARDPGAAVAVPTGTGSLSGIVVDADNRPLRRASVSIGGDMRLNRTTITDEAGRFVLSGLPTGRFTITAAKGGYPPMSYGAKRPYRVGSGVLLADGQRVGGITLKLARGAVITGTVFDDRGLPMPGVPVMPYEVRTSLTGERVFGSSPIGGAGVTTDDRGMYRIFGLPPGDYTVGTAWFFSNFGGDVRVPTDAEIRAAFEAVTQPPAASRPGSAPAARPPAPRFNFAPVFYPDSVDPLAAVVMSLAAGDERDGVDIRMQFRPMSQIEGTVLGLDGPARDVGMVLFRRSRVQALNSTTYWRAKADGTFSSSSLPPGEYTVMAETGGPGRPPLWAMAEVTLTGAEPATVSLTLQPAMVLTGRMVFEGTALKPPDPSRVRVSLFAMQGTTASNSATPSAVDASGRFSISGVTPGRFRLNASVPNTAAPGEPAWSVGSVTLGGLDVTDLPIEITPGAAPAVNVTWTDQVSELSGVLNAPSGQPATDYFVIALPADRRHWSTLSRRIVSARPDASGRYIFRGLPAGEYRIALTTDLVSGDLNDSEALARLAAQSAPVSIGAGEKKVFDIRVGG